MGHINCQGASTNSYVNITLHIPSCRCFYTHVRCTQWNLEQAPTQVDPIPIGIGREAFRGIDRGRHSWDQGHGHDYGQS